MSEPINAKQKKFTPLVLKPRRLLRVHYTPNKGREYHTVSYYDEFGQRQRKVYPERSRAEAEAAKLRGEIDNGITPGLLLNGRERLIYERALEIARSVKFDLDILARDAAEARAVLGEASLADAARFYEEHRIKVVQRPVAEVVSELVNDRMKNGRSQAYIRDLKTRLGHFADAFRCPISSVEWKDIEKYLDTTNAVGRYRKNLICSIGTLFNFARDRSYIHRDHPGVKLITKPAGVSGEKRVFTPAEGRRLLLGLPARILPSAVIGMFTPIRTAEIERMDWSAIDLKEGHIRITARDAKKRIRRIVPIPPNLKCWLMPFESAAGKVCPFTRLTNQWNKFAARAGVQWSNNVHRHSGISYTVALTRSVQEVALISGNSPDVIRDDYLKCVTRDEARKWFSIEPPSGWRPVDTKKNGFRADQSKTLRTGKRFTKSR